VFPELPPPLLPQPATMTTAVTPTAANALPLANLMGSPPPVGPYLSPAARALFPVTQHPRRAACWRGVPARHAGPRGTGRYPPLTRGIDEIVDCAWPSAALGEAVPVIAAWIAVQIACETFG